MKQIKFINKPAYLINDNETREKIGKIIQDKLDISLNFRNFTLLNDGNIDFLKKDIEKYVFGPVTFGKKFFLFLTKLEEEKCTIFINKKRPEQMILCKLDFDDKLFNNTLIDGELFKQDNKGYFQAIDIYLYKDENIYDKNLEYRMSKLNKVFKEKYTENKFDPCKFYIIKYSELSLFESFYSVRDNLGFKVSGVTFKNREDNKNYNFVFMENRKSITKPTTEKFDVVFKLKKTELPDVYDMYCLNNGIEYNYGIASISTLLLSEKLRILFSTKDEMIWGCSYVKSFRNFVPIKNLVNKKLSSLDKVKSFIL